MDVQRSVASRVSGRFLTEAFGASPNAGNTSWRVRTPKTPPNKNQTPRSFHPGGGLRGGGGRAFFFGVPHRDPPAKANADGHPNPASAQSQQQTEWSARQRSGLRHQQSPAGCQQIQ